MPNVIKYTTGATEAGCLRKGNMLIGNNTADNGLTFFNGINPPSGGYTIYLNKASGGPSIYCPANDTQLISITNQIAGANYTTAAQCLAYFASQTDKICVNFNYEGIVTNGLVLNLDAGFRPSYPTTGTTWYDLSGNSTNGTLTNGPTFNSTNSGSIVFDGVDDYADTNLNTNFSTSDFTLYSWVYPEFDSDIYGRPIITKNGNGSCNTYDFALEYGRQTNKFSLIMDGGTGNPSLYTTTFAKNNWYNVVATREYLGGTNYKCTIYVNGTSNATVTGYFTGGNGTKTTIGKFIDCAPVGNWLGKISLCSIYNRALNATEVLQNYNAQKGRFGL